MSYNYSDNTDAGVNPSGNRYQNNQFNNMPFPANFPANGQFIQQPPPFPVGGNAPGSFDLSRPPPFPQALPNAFSNPPPFMNHPPPFPVPEPNIGNRYTNYSQQNAVPLPPANFSIPPFQNRPPPPFSVPPPAPHIPPPGDSFHQTPYQFPVSKETFSNKKDLSLETEKETSKKSEALTAKETGAQKMHHWLQKNGKTQRLKKKMNAETNVKIWQAVDQLKEMKSLLDVMSTQVKEMEGQMCTVDNSSWESACTKIENLKMNYTRLQPVIKRESVEQICLKLKRIRAKRARIKRAKEAKFEERQRKLEEWQDRHKEIDLWQEKLRAKIREENQKQAQKLAADRTLSKVRREIHDANRLVETMTALEKLRLIRRDAAQKRGDADLGESRQSFEQKIADMTRLVESQLGVYKEEETKLKAFLQSEQEEISKKEKKQKEEKEIEIIKEEDKELESALFGQEDFSLSTLNDPLNPFNMYYQQAQNSLPSFVQVRHDWDSFVVSENTPGASSLPSSWVDPDVPSSSVWASALK